jgi:amidase
VLKNLALSGEPIVDPVGQIFGSEPRKQFTASEIADTNVAIWRYRKKYADYWNGTKELTGTGRPVDAVITPTDVYAGVIPGKLKYFGYTLFGNVLDYSVGVIPVTTADKTVDVYPSGEYKALSDMDATVREDCEFLS